MSGCSGHAPETPYADERRTSADARSEPAPSRIREKAAATRRLLVSMRLDTALHPWESPASLLLSASFRSSGPTPARRLPWTRRSGGAMGAVAALEAAPSHGYEQSARRRCFSRMQQRE